MLWLVAIISHLVIALLHNEIGHVVRSPSGSEQDELSPSSKMRTVWAKGDAWESSRIDAWETLLKLMCLKKSRNLMQFFHAASLPK